MRARCAQVGAKVMLGDRPVRVTLARCWASLSRWSRVRFIFSLMWGGLFMGGADLKAQVEEMKVRLHGALCCLDALIPACQGRASACALVPSWRC